MTSISSINPMTATAVEVVAEETSSERVAELCRLAAQAAPGYEARGRSFRADLLRAIGASLESRRADIVKIGQRETALPEARLHGELTRTVYQARLFADVVEEGSFLEAIIDHVADTDMGRAPDLRRMLIPIGPVAVFGASNFPLAFSVPGGDTISALAAGCPVVVKAHDSHPALSLLTFGAMQEAAVSVGAPEGLLGLVFGFRGGVELVQNHAIKAVGFTGSLSGGRALLDVIAQRSDPIPFYGELSSLNPVVLTPGAVAARADSIAEGLVASVTASAGQLCTKPGLVFVPHGEAGDELVSTAVNLVEKAPAMTLLNERISTSYDTISAEMEGREGVRVVSEGGRPSGDGFSVSPKLLELSAASLADGELGECFGPVAVLVRYDGQDLRAALKTLPASLTATVHAEADEADLIRDLSEQLKEKAGRLLYNGYPTGVHVSWAQQHGGPWPSTNSQYTSVGTTSVRRFQRPLTWQSAPAAVLPPELRDEYHGIVRRVDGVLVLPTS